MPFDREVFFDTARENPFPGHLNQEQVDGMNLVLDYWETDWERSYDDLRWLAYILATDKWETAHDAAPRGKR